MLYVVFHTGCQCGCDEEPGLAGIFHQEAAAREAAAEVADVDLDHSGMRDVYIDVVDDDGLIRRVGRVAP